MLGDRSILAFSPSGFYGGPGEAGIHAFQATITVPLLKELERGGRERG